MNVSGHRLSTTEIESALVSHPKVAEAAVVGANDEMTGQAVVAFVILRAGPRARRQHRHRQELRNHVAKEIGPIAKPKRSWSSRAAQDPLRQDHAPPAARRRRGPQVGDATTLADSSVMDLIKTMPRPRHTPSELRSSPGPRPTRPARQPHTHR
jgi:acetyl-CoA synthetase